MVGELEGSRELELLSLKELEEIEWRLSNTLSENPFDEVANIEWLAVQKALAIFPERTKMELLSD